MSRHTFATLFADHAASALARQMALGDVVGGRPRGRDIQKGILRFGATGAPSSCCWTRCRRK